MGFLRRCRFTTRLGDAILPGMKTDPESAARMVQERARQRKAARLVHAEEVKSRVHETVRAALPAGAQAWLIGSLAWGGYEAGSDVDIVYRGLSSAAVLELEQAIARAARVELDLLSFDALPESFRERVEAEGEPLHEC